MVKRANVTKVKAPQRKIKGSGKPPRLEKGWLPGKRAAKEREKRLKGKEV